MAKLDATEEGAVAEKFEVKGNSVLPRLLYGIILDFPDMV